MLQVFHLVLQHAHIAIVGTSIACAPHPSRCDAMWSEAPEFRKRHELNLWLAHKAIASVFASTN